VVCGFVDRGAAPARGRAWTALRACGRRATALAKSEGLGVATAGAELRLANGWGFMGKFDGEFGNGTQTYVGTGRVRYVW
jgi:hypothetical protein